jgi:prevent-host-death family protein
MEVNVHEAKTHLSRLLERVTEGEEVIIMRSNVPIARLVPVNSKSVRRDLGWARGEFTVPDDFDAPLPAEIEDSFYK